MADSKYICMYYRTCMPLGAKRGSCKALFVLIKTEAAYLWNYRNCHPQSEVGSPLRWSLDLDTLLASCRGENLRGNCLLKYISPTFTLAIRRQRRSERLRAPFAPGKMENPGTYKFLPLALEAAAGGVNSAPQPSRFHLWLTSSVAPGHRLRKWQSKSTSRETRLMNTLQA